MGDVHLHVIGAKMTDTCYSIEDDDGSVITWNVTELQRAADAGMFGQPLTFPIRSLAPPDWSKGNLSRRRVDYIRITPALLGKPIILIGNPPGHPAPFFCAVDGQHRLTARQELQFMTFSGYVVPHDHERAYRIQIIEIER